MGILVPRYAAYLNSVYCIWEFVKDLSEKIVKMGFKPPAAVLCAAG
jgi:hypothetical protein